MTEEIVLTKADRLDEPKPNPINPETMFRRIIIAPMNMFDSNDSVNEQFNNKDSVNEQFNNKDSINEQFKNKDSINEQFHKTKFDKKPRVVIFTSPLFSPSKQKQHISSILENIEQQNNVSVKNDELQDIMFKYFSLIICLIILISMTSIVFIKFLGVKQKYDSIIQISD